MRKTGEEAEDLVTRLAAEEKVLEDMRESLKGMMPSLDLGKLAPSMEFFFRQNGGIPKAN